MSQLLTAALSMYHFAKANEEEMCAEFKARAEENRKEYWDACKYPRKKKKAIRKKAFADFQLHTILSRPVIFS